METTRVYRDSIGYIMGRFEHVFQFSLPLIPIQS